jgi:hypothetical protein
VGLSSAGPAASSATYQDAYPRPLDAVFRGRIGRLGTPLLSAQTGNWISLIAVALSLSPPAFEVATAALWTHRMESPD